MKKQGFTLFEVMIVVPIIGIALPALLGLGSMLFKTVSQATARFEHVIVLKNFLVEAHENQWWKSSEKRTQHNEFPALDMAYSTKPVSDKSSLKTVKNLVIEQVDARWVDGGRTRTDSLVFLMYKPEKKEAQDKGGSKK